MKTARIRIDSIKDSDGWFSLGHELGLTPRQIYATFEYGEFANIEIVVDENLNIIGGKIIPSGKDNPLHGHE